MPVLRKGYDDILKDYDVIIMPTTPYVAPKLPTNGPLPIKGRSTIVFQTNPLTFPRSQVTTIDIGTDGGSSPVLSRGCLLSAFFLLYFFYIFFFTFDTHFPL